MIAVAALGDADFARLGQIARLRARGLADLEWKDLLNDAIRRVLDGTRRWPRDVPFVMFMREVMRSLASEAWRRQVRANVAEPESDESDPLAGLADDRPDPERTAIAHDLVEKLKGQLSGDDVALAIIAGIAEGQSPVELQRAAGLDPIQYESARRRIRRRVAAAPPEMFL